MRRPPDDDPRPLIAGERVAARLDAEYRRTRLETALSIGVGWGLVGHPVALFLLAGGDGLAAVLSGLVLLSAVAAAGAAAGLVLWNWPALPLSRKITGVIPWLIVCTESSLFLAAMLLR